MTKAEKAYIEAQRLIATAKSKGATQLNLDTAKTRALTHLPPEIAGLTLLRYLDLKNTHIIDVDLLTPLTGLTTLSLASTRVTDISPLASLTSLTELLLHGTQIADLGSLTALSTLSVLSLGGCQTTDFAPLSALTALTVLALNSTSIDKLDPLAKLTMLKTLHLNNTSAMNLIPLTTLVRLTTLGLDGTKIMDLRPLRRLPALAESPGYYGLSFSSTPATRADPRIAEIAEIEDAATRARELFAYLETWVPPGFAETDLPPRQPAPLETEIRNDMLVLRQNEQPPLPSGPIDNRARQGWQVLRDFRTDFGKSLSIANYRSLAAAIGAFDRAMGDHYDHLHQIGVGLAGQRLSNLSADLAFVETLPDGAGTELATLGAAVTTFANRFPEWLDYLHDPDAVAPMADLVAAALPAFNELAATLAASAGVAPDVAEEYRDEVELVRAAPHSELYARALLLSTADLLRTLTEDALIGMRRVANRVKTDVQDQATKFAAVVPGELRKGLFWSLLGLPAYIVWQEATLILSLSAKFPALLWWVPKALAALGVV